MELLNKTPFAAERVVLQDGDGRDLLVVVVKQTWTLEGGAVPRIADEQVPVQVADDFWGEPGEASTRYESDLAPHKPGTDVVLIGHARSPRGRAKELDVSLRVGPVSKTVRVFGERRWRRPLGRLRPSDPEPFESMPLVYERAFGGADLTPNNEKHHEFETRNTVGVGLMARRSQLSSEDVSVPNLEDPRELMRTPGDRPAPAAFGFVSRHWEPRRSRAGTYDRSWERTRSPLLPRDFDAVFHNGAHPDLISRAHLQGGEPVEVIHASPDGPLRFALPRALPKILQIAASEEQTPLEPVMDTVVIEPDERRLSIVWRATRDIWGSVYDPWLVQVEAEV